MTLGIGYWTRNLSVCATYTGMKTRPLAISFLSIHHIFHLFLCSARVSAASLSFPLSTPPHGFEQRSLCRASRLHFYFPQWPIRRRGRTDRAGMAQLHRELLRGNASHQSARWRGLVFTSITSLCTRFVTLFHSSGCLLIFCCLPSGNSRNLSKRPSRCPPVHTAFSAVTLSLPHSPWVREASSGGTEPRSLGLPSGRAIRSPTELAAVS